MTLEEVTRERLVWLRQRVAKGKGIWRERGYIKDDDWISLTSQIYVLESVLDKAGL